MTTEIKKPSDAIAAATHIGWISRGNDPEMLHDKYGFYELVCQLDAEHDRRAAWEKGVADKLVAQDQLLAKLLALNPEARDVVGVTASGATVHGLRPTMPLCADGSRVHDMQGQPSCPACGFTPKLAPAYAPTEETEEP